MKKKFGAFEAKTHLPKLLEAVLHGDKITITRRGEAIAMLVDRKSVV
jgi:prevent-host-death family protein